jgi:hypothetical protein
MTLSRLLLLLGIAGSLGGCVTGADLRARDEQRCVGFGFRPGSEAFANCLQNYDLDRSADRRALLYGPGPGIGVGFGYGVGFRRW